MKKVLRIVSLIVCLIIGACSFSVATFADSNEFNVSIVSAYWTTQQTAEITFDKDIELSDDAKSLIEYQGASFLRKPLGASDELICSGNKILVNILGQRVGDNLFLKPGAIKTANGAFNAEEITVNAKLIKKITKAEYTPTTLESTGGTISAKISGINLYTPNEWLVAKVYQGTDVIKTINLDEKSTSFTFSLPENTGADDVSYTVRYVSSRYDYNAKEVEVEEGANPHLTVRGRAVAANPVITEINYDRTELKAAGGSVTVSLTGEALKQLTTNDFLLSYNGNSLSDVIPVYSAPSDNSATLTFSLPENTSDVDKVYYLKVNRGAENLSNKEQAITVLAVNTNPLVESIKYDMNSSDLHGGTHIWNVGSNLKATLTGDNLEKLSEKDFKIELDNKIVDNVKISSEKTGENTAIVVFSFPANQVEEELIYRITVISAVNGINDAVKEIPIDAKPQDKTDKFQIDADKWSASYIGDGVIRISIESPQGIRIRKSDEVYKFNKDFIDQIIDYILFAENREKPYQDIRTLSENDEVKVVDNNIEISFADKEQEMPKWIIFRTGALEIVDGKDSEGNDIVKVLGNDEQNKDHARYINQGPHINSISYNRITFDKNGGEVIATATGSQLKESSPSVWAKVFVDSEKNYSKDIVPEVEINEAGDQAVFRFSVPANNTDKTITYRLTPVINGTNAIPQYIKGYDVISVLPDGAEESDTTLSSLEIQGAYDMDDELDVFKTSTSSAQFTSKVDVIIRGTNLSSKKTQLKAVDENGIVWPMLPVYECGATIRWQNSAYYLPEKSSKNEQHIELLLPRRLGTTRTFTIYVAPDGKNYLNSPTGTVIIENHGLFDHNDMALRGFVESDLTELTSFDVMYVDKNGKELAKKDTYPGYGITELYHLGIKPKEIPGYKLVKTYPLNLNSMLLQPIQHTSGEFIFEEGQYFIASLKGKPVKYIYEESGDNKNTERNAQRGTDGTAFGPGASAEAADYELRALKSDADPAGTRVAPLLLKSSKQTKNSIRLKWTGVSDANKYIVYGNACGKNNSFIRLGVVGTKSFIVRNINKALKKGTYYKFVVVAVDAKDNVVSTSKIIHVATSGGKVGNFKSITTKAKKKNVLKKGKKLKLKAKAVPKSKKQKVKKHSAIRYESTNTRVATISKSGVVKAIGKGKCKVYAYAQDGTVKAISITVK